MSLSLRFDDHPGYHRSFLAMTAGAALGGGVATLAGLSAGPWVGGLVGVAAGLSWVDRPRRAWLMGARLTAAAVGLAAVSIGAGPWGLALALGVGLAVGATARRALLVLAAGVVTGLWAGWAASTVVAAQALTSLPGWVTGALAATGIGLAAGLARSLRHVAVAVDPVAAAYRALPPLSGEARDLVDRGRSIWVASASLSLPGDENGDLVKDGVLKLFGVASKLAANPAIDPTDIDRRITEVEARIEACTDAVAREQYKDARGALVDQRRYADRVGTARERIIARMHHCVATLEKFRMACAQLDATAAAREAADARSAMSVLGDLGDGLAIVGEPPALPAAAPPG